MSDALLSASFIADTFGNTETMKKVAKKTKGLFGKKEKKSSVKDFAKAGFKILDTAVTGRSFW